MLSPAALKLGSLHIFSVSLLLTLLFIQGSLCIKYQHYYKPCRAHVKLIHVCKYDLTLKRSQENKGSSKYKCSKVLPLLLNFVEVVIREIGFASLSSYYHRFVGSVGQNYTDWISRCKGELSFTFLTNMLFYILI